MTDGYFSHEVIKVFEIQFVTSVVAGSEACYTTVEIVEVGLGVRIVYPFTDSLRLLHIGGAAFGEFFRLLYDDIPRLISIDIIFFMATSLSFGTSVLIAHVT